MKNFRQIFFIVILLLAILKPTLAQEREIATTQEGLSNSEVTFQLNIQVLAHNYKGWTTPITGMGMYIGYSHFWGGHRLSGGVELAYRNALQCLLIPDYHYEWIFGRCRLAVGLDLLGGYCGGMGFAAGVQPSFEVGYIFSPLFSMTISTGYRFIYYSNVSKETMAEVGNHIGEIPICLNFKF